MALWESSFPHSRRLKLGMPTSLPSGQDSGNGLEQRVEKIYIWLLQEVVPKVSKLAQSAAWCEKEPRGQAPPQAVGTGATLETLQTLFSPSSLCRRPSLRAALRCVFLRTSPCGGSMGGPGAALLHFGLLSFTESWSKLRGYPCSVFHRARWGLRKYCVSCRESFLVKRYRPYWSRVSGCGYRRTRLTQPV